MKTKLREYSNNEEKACVISFSGESGNITYVNDYFQDLSGYKKEFLIGNNYKVLKSSHQAYSLLKVIWRTISTGAEWQGITKNKTKSGDDYYANTIVIPSFSSKNKTTSYFAILFDVTKKIKNENMLKETIKELSEVNFALDQFAIVTRTDSYGKIKYVNDKFCEISGFDKDELIDQDHRIVSSKHHSKEFFKKMWTTINAGNVWTGEIKNKHKDGQFYWVDTTIIPLFNSHPEGDANLFEPYQFIGIRKDITKVKTLEEESQKAKAIAFNRSKIFALGELSAGIAHEIGNPINAIQGRAEMLHQMYENNELSPAVTNDYSLRIIKLCEKISKIIEGLSTYTRDGCKAPVVSVNITKLLDEIISFSTHKFRNNKIHLLRVGADSYSIIKAREAEIAQVITNLLNNACDAVSTTKVKEISIRQGADSKTCFFEISDSGTGIAPEMIELLYEPFITTKGINGTGLGLNLSHKIIHRYNGTIDYKTSPENGTCFRIEFPRARTAKESL